MLRSTAIVAGVLAGAAIVAAAAFSGLILRCGPGNQGSVHVVFHDAEFTPNRSVSLSFVADNEDWCFLDPGDLAIDARLDGHPESRANIVFDSARPSLAPFADRETPVTSLPLPSIRGNFTLEVVARPYGWQTETVVRVW